MTLVRQASDLFQFQYLDISFWCVLQCLRWSPPWPFASADWSRLSVAESWRAFKVHLMMQQYQKWWKSHVLCFSRRWYSLIRNVLYPCCSTTSNLISWQRGKTTISEQLCYLDVSTASIAFSQNLIMIPVLPPLNFVMLECFCDCLCAQATTPMLPCLKTNPHDGLQCFVCEGVVQYSRSSCHNWCRVSARALEWGTPSGEEACRQLSEEIYDVIIVADCIYSDQVRINQLDLFNCARIILLLLHCDAKVTTVQGITVCNGICK